MVRSLKADTATTTTTSPTSPSSPTAELASRKGQPNPPSGPATEAIEGIRFSSLMNMRYHAAREAFLDGTHRWLMFLIIVIGAGSFLDLLPKDGNWKEACAALTAVFAALDLVFDLSNRARQHSVMRRRYSDLLAEVLDGRISAEAGDAELNRFNSDEEPVYQAMLLTAWNAAQETVYGDTAMRYEIPSWVSLLKNLWRFEGKTFPVHDPRKALSASGMVSA